MIVLPNPDKSPTVTAMTTTLPKAVRQLAQALSRLPGIGPKTAQRLSIFLLRQPKPVAGQLADTIASLHDSVHICKECFNLAETDTCAICRDPDRDHSLLCIVEDPLDIEAIERGGTYQGLYHVLGGVLSPLEGIGVGQLNLNELFARIKSGRINEVIIALDQNMESEATIRHIMSYLQDSDVSVTRLARGLPTGGDIEFADALTLNAAFEGRKRI